MDEDVYKDKVHLIFCYFVCKPRFTVRDVLAPPFWRDRFGATVLAQDVLAKSRFGAGVLALININ